MMVCFMVVFFVGVVFVGVVFVGVDDDEVVVLVSLGLM